MTTGSLDASGEVSEGDAAELMNIYYSYGTRYACLGLLSIICRWWCDANAPSPCQSSPFSPVLCCLRYGKHGKLSYLEVSMRGFGASARTRQLFLVFCIRHYSSLDGCVAGASNGYLRHSTPPVLMDCSPTASSDTNVALRCISSFICPRHMFQPSALVAINCVVSSTKCALCSDKRTSGASRTCL